jgi:hypothetical protein
MALNGDISALLDALEAIRFFTHTLDDEEASKVELARSTVPHWNRNDRLEFRAVLKKYLDEVREHYGAIADNDKLHAMFLEALEHRGYAYLPKRFIDREMFTRYERVFGRWPHMPSHALVVFDPVIRRPLSNIYQVEAELFNDAQHLLAQGRKCHKEIADFRKRDAKDQRLLQTHLRSAASATFQTLEAFLNGVSYDCFTAHHDELAIPDHDLLGEWNSAKKRRSFVAFERKLRDYPRIAAETIGKQLDVTAWDCTVYIIDVGKRLRDAITHPSPFVDPTTKQNEKIFWIVGINLDVVDRLLIHARDYMQRVQTILSDNPQKSAPWLFE